MRPSRQAGGQTHMAKIQSPYASHSFRHPVLVAVAAAVVVMVVTVVVVVVVSSSFTNELISEA